MASTLTFLLTLTRNAEKVVVLLCTPDTFVASASLFLMYPNSTSLWWFPTSQGTETLTHGPMQQPVEKLQNWRREVEMGQCQESNYSSVWSVELAMCLRQIPEHFIWRATELTVELKLQPKMEPQQWSSTAWPQLYFDYFHPDGGQVTLNSKKEVTNYINTVYIYIKKKGVSPLLFVDHFFFWGLKILFKLFLQV